MNAYFLLTIVLSVVGLLVSYRLKSKFNTYSKMPLRNDMNGADVAKAMLDHYGIHDVTVESVQGQLTDHYNPQNKTVNLSPDVYAGSSVAAAAVAAHECGHAVQHATAYPMLQLRSSLVPVVHFASITQQYIMIAAFMFFTTFPMLLWIAVGAFFITTLFSFVTLPVEFDASNRALAWLNTSGILQNDEHEAATDALKWAAMTYVVAAISSLVMLIYLFLRARD